MGRAFGAKVRVDLKARGMHLLAHFDTQETDLALAARAAAAGLGPAPLLCLEHRRASATGAHPEFHKHSGGARCDRS
jgi:hypothetical protein